MQRRRNGASLRQLAIELGYASSACAMLSDVLRGRPDALSLEAENTLRMRLGLPPLHAYSLPPCPSCGGLHAVEDCGGIPEARVAVLGPRDTVVRKGQPRRSRPRYFRPCLSLDPQRRITQLRRLLAEAEEQISNSYNDAISL